MRTTPLGLTTNTKGWFSIFDLFFLPFLPQPLPQSLLDCSLNSQDFQYSQSSLDTLYSFKQQTHKLHSSIKTAIMRFTVTHFVGALASAGLVTSTAVPKLASDANTRKALSSIFSSYYHSSSTGSVSGGGCDAGVNARKPSPFSVPSFSSSILSSNLSGSVSGGCNVPGGCGCDDSDVNDARKPSPVSNLLFF